MKLTPEQARGELAKALRSGEYKQGLERLRSGDRFCCLGVACDLYRKIEGEGEWTQENATFWFNTKTSPDSIHLPPIVQRWLGFATAHGSSATSLVDSLDNLNDKGATFEQIASRIENGEVLLSPQDPE